MQMSSDEYPLVPQGITKPWRVIVDPAGATISQIKRYINRSINEFII